MSLVVDASVVAAALVDAGTSGRWAEEVLLADDLLAPHLMPVEVTSVLRRTLLAGRLDDVRAALAVDRLHHLRAELFPLAPFADRVWQLGDTVTAYDAWYVALAEQVGAPLATLDARLTTAPGPTCRFLTAPGPQQPGN